MEIKNINGFDITVEFTSYAEDIEETTKQQIVEKIVGLIKDKIGPFFNYTHEYWDINQIKLSCELKEGAQVLGFSKVRVFDAITEGIQGYTQKIKYEFNVIEK